MTDFPHLPLTENANPRTEAALARLRKAMSDMEADIAAHQGVYPYNHGRVTQSELCRRADVKKATLQTPLHKDTTRVRILAWLEDVTSGLAHTRAATREKVTAVADGLASDVERLQSELQATLLQLGLAEQRVQALERECTELRARLGAAMP